MASLSQFEYANWVERSSFYLKLYKAATIDISLKTTFVLFSYASIVGL